MQPLTRRQFLRGLLASGVAGLATSVYAWQIEPRRWQIVRRNLPIRRLPAGLVGHTLALLSDLHVSERYDWHYQIDACQAVQQMAPDFVLYGGDYVTYDSEHQLTDLEELLRFAPLGRLGTAAILGNHDYGVNWRQAEVADAVAARLEQAGITVLRNRIAHFAGLQVAGLDDFWGPYYDPGPTLASLDAGRPAVVLCHNPDVADQPVWSGYQGWILAGHTHGGQVKPPFLPPPLLPVQNRRYTAGAFDLGDGRRLYISRGLGNLWPVRFNARPEVTIFDLTRG